MFPSPKKPYTARAIMKLLHEVENLKRLPRAGWKIKNIPNPESVAEHSFRLSIMTFFAPAHLDQKKLRDMALIHDFGEIIAGDYTPHDNVPKKTKHEQEKLFFQYTETILPGHPTPQYWLELWQEYEERKTPETMWLYDADKMESVIQSREYAGRGYTNLEEFLGLIPKFTTSHMATWGKVTLEELQQGQIRRQQIPIIFVTGLPSTGKTTQCKRLSKEFDALYLSLHDILLQKSTDREDPHADFAALYLQKGLDTSPIGFMTDLLKDNIDEGIKQGKRCVIVDEFPRSVQQLRAFDENVQKGNLILLLTRSAEAPRQGNASDYAIRMLQDLEEQQPKELFKKINCDISEEDAYVLLKEAAQGFMKAKQ
ncbi:HD domain-containing protein [Leptodontidium sp. 2 PMI_412]|nr:HD domain-containing protein [Leptodontidium sp. 2 PMI_412]